MYNVLKHSDYSRTEKVKVKSYTSLTGISDIIIIHASFVATYLAGVIAIILRNTKKHVSKMKLYKIIK